MVSPASDARLALVLSGGNALGAYQAGAYEALAARGLAPDWVVGASIGAVNAVMIAGNRPEQRIERMRDYWLTAPVPPLHWDALLPPLMRRSMRAAGVLGTSWLGQPHSFSPRLPALGMLDPFAAASLYDTRPLAATLERLADFALLNDGPVRVSVNTVDLETGEDIIFSSERVAIGPEHIRASSAFPPLYPPVRIEGRLLGDAGLSANLPVGIALAAPLAPAMLCLAIDVITPVAQPPQTLAEAMQRRQDLMLASQSRHAVAAWIARYAAGDLPPVTLVHLIYAAQDDEPPGKILDYSPEGISSRWAAGRADMDAVLGQLASGALPLASQGLVVHRVLGGTASAD